MNILSGSNLSKLNHIRHAFFTRQGGVSINDFSSLNCKEKTDNPSHVDENKRRIISYLNSDSWVGVNQKHTGEVVYVSNATGACKEADAMITDKKGLCLSVITADCVPILISDTRKNLICAIHAGWRGIFKNIIGNAINKMQNMGGSDFVATIGPCIHQESFEVGIDFKKNYMEAKFSNKFPFEKLSIPSKSDDKFLFDLPNLAKMILNDLRVINCEIIKYNTYTNEQLFFSYRRSQHKKQSHFGCQASSIVLL